MFFVHPLFGQGGVSLNPIVSPTVVESSSGWVDPVNGLSPNSSYASYTSKSNATNFSAGSFPAVIVPDSSIVKGIELYITGYCSTAQIWSTGEVYLGKSPGTRASNNKGDSGAGTNFWSKSPATKTFGGPTDLWGTTWTVSEVRSLSVWTAPANYAGANGYPFYLDGFAVRVYT